MLYTANRREQCILDPLSPGVYNQFALFNFAVQGMHWRRKRGGGGGGVGVCVIGGHVPPTFIIGGQWYACALSLLTPHFNFLLELHVYITLTNNYLAFFIYQLIILWTISIN